MDVINKNVVKEDRRDKKTKVKKNLIIIGFCLFICFVSALCGRPRAQKVWPSLDLSFTKDKKYGDTYQKEEYGTITSGPYLDLPPGCYRLQWYMESDGINRVHLQSSNGAKIVPDIFETNPESNIGDVYFEILNSVHNLNVSVEFIDGTDMTIHSFRLYSPLYKDNIVLLCISAILVASVLLLHQNCEKFRRNEAAFIVLCLAAAIASLPFMRKDIPPGWDVQFHAGRIMNLADSIKSGQIFAKWGGYSYNGYGAVTSVFYPDLFLYPTAILVILGCSVTFAYNATMTVFSFITAFTMYAAARQLKMKNEGAVVSSILYTLSGFRIVGATGEMLGVVLAMAFVPLYTSFLIATLNGKKNSWIGLAISAYAIFSCHMVSTLLCGLLAVGLMILYARTLLRDSQARYNIVLAVVCVLLLSLGRLYTLFDLFRSGVTSSVMDFGLADSAYDMQDLLKIDGKIGAHIWIGAVLGLLALLQEKNKEQKEMYAFFLCGGCVAIFIASAAFPWGYLENMGDHIFSKTLQFPWRFLMITAVLFSFLGGYGWSFFTEGQQLPKIIAVIAFCLCIIQPNLNVTASEGKGILFGEGSNPYMSFPEYQLTGTNVNDTRSREIAAADTVKVISFSRNGKKYSVEFEAYERGSITFPLFAFPGFRTQYNGGDIPWRQGENNRLTVDVEGRMIGTINAEYVGKKTWMAMDLISLFSLIALISYSFYLKKQGNTKLEPRHPALHER